MIHINLLEYREIRKRIRIQKQFAATGGLFIFSLCVVALLTNIINGQLRGLQHTLHSKQGELEQLKRQVKEVRNFEKKEIGLKETLKIIKILKKKQTGTSKLLDEINISMSSEVWFTSFSYEGKRVHLKGYSFSNIGIASFMKNMEKSIYFNSVELISSEQSKVGGQKVKKFTIVCNFSIPEKSI